MQAGYYALHGRATGAPSDDALFELKGGEIAVYRGDPAAGKGKERQVTPVYAAADGPLAVPTGLLFVRFKEGISAADHREEIERSGYEITQLPGYAPNAAWVRAHGGGDIALSLQGMKRLESLSDVENVEPQMLMESAKR